MGIFYVPLKNINSKVKSQTRSTSRGAKVQTRAFSDVNLAISGANALMLSLGRFVFMPYQRAEIAKAGLPTQNGETHYAAGDVKAEEASFLNTTNDPSGFTLIDVMAWGLSGTRWASPRLLSVPSLCFKQTARPRRSKVLCA